NVFDGVFAPSKASRAQFQMSSSEVHDTSAAANSNDVGNNSVKTVDSMLLQAKWFLGGQDVLFGRKTIRQRLHNIAESKGLSAKMQYSEPWGWCSPCTDPVTIKGEKKFDATSLEEGEVVDEGIDLKRSLKGLSQVY
ncbi:mediator of RNA polymerase II transcription subunit 12-like protein, partial [Trifolium pratense]